MLMTVEGVYQDGQVRLLEPLTGVARARVVVTVLPDPPNLAVDPLDLPLTPEERVIWEDLPQFRADHPVRFLDNLPEPDSGVAALFDPDDLATLRAAQSRFEPAQKRGLCVSVGAPLERFGHRVFSEARKP